MIDYFLFQCRYDALKLSTDKITNTSCNVFDPLEKKWYSSINSRLAWLCAAISPAYHTFLNIITVTNTTNQGSTAVTLKLLISFGIKFNGGSRISHGGVPASKMGALTYYFPKLLLKTA